MFFCTFSALDVILSSDFGLSEASPNGRNPSSRLKSLISRINIYCQRPAEDALESSFESSETAEDIPIFCAGGCGEVMGYVRIGDSIPHTLVPLCESAKASTSRSPSRCLRTPMSLQNCVPPPRDLRKSSLRSSFGRCPHLCGQHLYCTWATDRNLSGGIWDCGMDRRGLGAVEAKKLNAALRSRRLLVMPADLLDS